MSESLAIVMAAGKGTRMESDLPKVLVPACGRPMIEYVLDTLDQAGVSKSVVVVGYRADVVRETLAHRDNLAFAEQTEQLGTGHAVMMCREQIDAHDGAVLVVTGDSPMIQAESVGALLDLYASEKPACILGSSYSEDPTGLGRIVRNEADEFIGIVEEKDATDAQRKINEVNMSTYVFDAKLLSTTLDKLTNDNKQSEYYITDCPGILRDEGHDVRALPVLKPCESLSVNNMAQLAIVEAEMRKMGMAS